MIEVFVKPGKMDKAIRALKRANNKDGSLKKLKLRNRHPKPGDYRRAKAEANEIRKLKALAAEDRKAIYRRGGNYIDHAANMV